MGINSGVIDLLVALSYPERFVVERRDRGGSWSSGGLGGFGGGFYDPVWYGDLYPYYITITSRPSATAVGGADTIRICLGERRARLSS